jgi:hypothetical protein
VTCAIQGLSDGLLMRNRIEPDVATVDLLTTAILSLLPSIAVPVGSPMTTVHDYRGTLAGDLASSWREHVDGIGDNVYERVIAAFQKELARHCLAGVSINGVAREADSHHRPSRATSPTSTGSFAPPSSTRYPRSRQSPNSISPAI